MRAWGRVVLSMAVAAMAPAAVAQQWQPVQHSDGAWPIFDGLDPAAMAGRADAGVEYEQNRSPADLLAQHRRLAAALGRLTPGTKGQTDVYIVSVALDSDPVFGREAREAARVLARRYQVPAGHSIVLAGSDGSGPGDLPMATPDALAVTLARVRELIDPTQDVVVLYTTGHGAPFGLTYHDGNEGYGAISPLRLWLMTHALGIDRKLMILSACFAGIFVPQLGDDDTAIVTAADAQHTSFGCQPGNDWTFFGDAMINHGLRKPEPLASAFAEARGLVSEWEHRAGADASNPQLQIGKAAARWLGQIEAHLPAASAPVGRPAIETTGQPGN